MAPQIALIQSLMFFRLPIIHYERIIKFLKYGGNLSLFDEPVETAKQKNAFIQKVYNEKATILKAYPECLVKIVSDLSITNKKFKRIRACQKLIAEYKSLNFPRYCKLEDMGARYAWPLAKCTLALACASGAARHFLPRMEPYLGAYACFQYVSFAAAESTLHSACRACLIVASVCAAFVCCTKYVRRAVENYLIHEDGAPLSSAAPNMQGEQSRTT